MNVLTFTTYPKVLVIVCLLFASWHSKAQDIHFSQFWNAPFQMSPALTGVFDGDLRFHGNLRSQWYTVPVPYRTFYGAFDTKLIRAGGSRSNFFSGGLILNYDQAGDSKMATTQLGLQVSYTKTLTSKDALTGGVQLNGFQRSFKLDDLQFGTQYNGKFYDSNLGSQENFTSQNVFYPSVGLGVNWRHAASGKRTLFDIGAGAFHLNRPKKSFERDPDAYLFRRFDIYGISAIQLAGKVDLLLNAIGRFQEVYTEILGDVGIRYHVSEDLGKELALQAGVAYRFGGNEFNERRDAFSPNIGFLWANTWQVGLSYDINISKFRTATDNLGGPEISVIYTRRKDVTPPPDYCPTCPLHF